MWNHILLLLIIMRKAFIFKVNGTMKSSCFSQIFVWELSSVLQPIHSHIPKWFIYSLFFFFPAGQIINAAGMLRWKVFICIWNVKSSGCLSMHDSSAAFTVFLSVGRNAFLRDGFRIQLGEQGTERENGSLWGVCLPHIIIFRFTLRKNHPGWAC